MGFNEKLILTVQKYGELYDLGHKYYSNLQRKEEIWREIGEQMGETSDMCRESWRRLRDNYRKAKQLRRTKSGQRAKKIKPIKYEKEMTFLNCHLQQPQELTTTNLLVFSSDEENVDDPTKSTVDIHISERATPNSVTRVSNPSTSSLPGNNNNPPKRKPRHVEQSPMQEYLQFKREQQQQQSNVHPLDVFFSSMAATVKSFPVTSQFKIKQQVFKLVTDTEAKLINSVLPPTTTTTTPLPSLSSDLNLISVIPVPSHSKYEVQSLDGQELLNLDDYQVQRSTCYEYDYQI